MGSSKKVKRKHPEVQLDDYLELAKGKVLDSSLRTIGTISKNKNEMHESPLESDLNSQLPVKQRAENDVGLCGMSKKLKRKSKRSKVEVSLDEHLEISKGKTIDTSLQNTGIISKNKNEVHESPLESDPTSPLAVKQIAENTVELCRMHKKLERKNKKSKAWENNDLGQNLVEDNLKMFEGELLGTSFQNTKTVSEIKNEVHGSASQGVSNLELLAHTAVDHAEVSSSQRQIKRKKRCNGPDKKNLGEKLLVTGSLCDSDVTDIEHLENSELDSIRNKNNNDKSTGNYLITAEPSILLKCANTNSMKKKDVSTEINTTSIEMETLNTYQRKVKKMFCSPSNTFELGKQKGTTSSLQVVQNNLMGEVCVSCSDPICTSVESKGMIESKNVKDEDELNVVQKVVLEIGVAEEEKMDKSPKFLVSSENRLEKVKEVRPVSGDVSAGCSDSKTVLGKGKRKAKTKVTTHGNKAHEDISRFKLSNEHFPQENDRELNKVHKRVKELEFFSENMEESPTDLEDISLSLSEAVDIVKHACSPKLEVINNSVEDVSTGKMGRKSRKKKVRSIIHEGKSSDDTCTGNPSPKQPAHHGAHNGFSKENPKVETSYVSAVENQKVSLTESNMGEIAPSSIEGAVKDSTIKKGNNPLEMLTKEGCNFLLPAVENSSVATYSANGSDWRPASGRCNFREEKVESSVEEDKASDDTFVCHPSTKKLEEITTLLSTEDSMKDSVIKKVDNPLEILSKESFGSLLSAVDNTPIGTYSAHCSDRRPSSGVSKFTENVESSVDEEKASDDAFVCNPFTKQLEDLQECRNLGENKFKEDSSCAFGEEKLEVSLNECLMEEKTLSINENAIKDAATRDYNLLDSLERGSIGLSRIKLLILDLNGLLADIVSHIPDGYKADKTIGQKALFKRPFCDDFLKFCFERFNVGVWSSRTKRNVDSVVDFLMGDMKQKLLFCWDQSHCTETGYSTVDNRNKPLVLKELKKLWDKHEPNLPWEKGEYNKSNTLLLDDSPYKALRNPLHTGVFPSSYRFHHTDDNSLGPGGDIRVYLEGLAMAEDVQKYVAQHHFGQRAITDKNPSWGYYQKVIGNDNSCLPT